MGLQQPVLVVAVAQDWVEHQAARVVAVLAAQFQLVV
jgi:hypothetical protein